MNDRTRALRDDVTRLQASVRWLLEQSAALSEAGYPATAVLFQQDADRVLGQIARLVELSG